MPVAVVAHRPGWADEFAAERDRLVPHLAPWLTGGLHHVGSTAVAGLAAKPVIDMVAGVASLAGARAALPVLAELGYGHADHRPHEALWFFLPSTSAERLDERRCHLHLTAVGSDLWVERLAFRDALRADAGLAREYEELKLALAREADGIEGYTAGKRAFVARVLAGAGVALA